MRVYVCCYDISATPVSALLCRRYLSFFFFSYFDTFLHAVARAMFFCYLMSLDYYCFFFAIIFMLIICLIFYVWLIRYYYSPFACWLRAIFHYFAFAWFAYLLCYWLCPFSLAIYHFFFPAIKDDYYWYLLFMPWCCWFLLCRFCCSTLSPFIMPVCLLSFWCLLFCHVRYWYSLFRFFRLFFSAIRHIMPWVPLRLFHAGYMLPCLMLPYAIWLCLMFAAIDAPDAWCLIVICLCPCLFRVILLMFILFMFMIMRRACLFRFSIFPLTLHYAQQMSCQPASDACSEPFYVLLPYWLRYYACPCQPMARFAPIIYTLMLTVLMSAPTALRHLLLFCWYCHAFAICFSLLMLCSYALDTSFWFVIMLALLCHVSSRRHMFAPLFFTCSPPFTAPVYCLSLPARYRFMLRPSMLFDATRSHDARAAPRSSRAMSAYYALIDGSAAPRVAKEVMSRAKECWAFVVVSPDIIFSCLLASYISTTRAATLCCLRWCHMLLPIYAAWEHAIMLSRHATMLFCRFTLMIFAYFRFDTIRCCRWPRCPCLYWCLVARFRAPMLFLCHIIVYARYAHRRLCFMLLQATLSFKRCLYAHVCFICCLLMLITLIIFATDAPCYWYFVAIAWFCCSLIIFACFRCLPFATP